MLIRRMGPGYSPSIGTGPHPPMYPSSGTFFRGRVRYNSRVSSPYLGLMAKT